jgi:tRNA-(ms[2]io[6]A)-hydroxylase
LLCKTPQTWIEKALNNINTLLIDHANCEKKAASTAMSFLYRHRDKKDLILKMSKIAREELRHFEQVMTIMTHRNIDYIELSASRYAEGLRAGLRTDKKGRFIDALIIGAFVEARSCERFEAIAPYLDKDLQKFYLGLLESERRHFTIYLDMAHKYSEWDISDRIRAFAIIEKNLIESTDEIFRFHSGI